MTMRDAIAEAIYHGVSDECMFSMRQCERLADAALQRYEDTRPIGAAPPAEADDPIVVEAVRLAMIRTAKPVNGERYNDGWPGRGMRRASRGRIALVLKGLRDAGFRVYLDGKS